MRRVELNTESSIGLAVAAWIDPHEKETWAVLAGSGGARHNNYFGQHGPDGRSDRNTPMVGEEDLFSAQ